MTDLIAYLKASADKVGDQLDLSEATPGDELNVVTRHTEYVFKIIEDSYRASDVFSIRSTARSRENHGMHARPIVIH